MVNYNTGVKANIPKKCIVCQNKQPNFGLPTDKTAKYCGTCKKDGMVDLKHSKCIVCQIRRPVFGMPTDKTAQYCRTCKKDGMVDLKNPKCIVCKNKHPNFGLSTDKTAQYCGACKKDGMVDIKSPKCIVCQNKQPVFGMPTDKTAQYCVTCKKDGMVNIKSPKCIVCQIIRPHFGLSTDKTAKYCGACKKDGMINIKSPKCIVCKKKHPNFGLSTDKTPQYCGICKKDGMVDLKHPKCNSKWCNTKISNKQYEGYCAYCFMHLFPDKPMSRNYKTKESAVVEFVKNQYSKIDIITDKKIQGGCSKRRPDIFIDLGYQIIIVEVDENQHTDYDCSCENKRIMELSQDVGHRRIVFIRFNPDDYELKGENIKSCWGINKNGICCVKKNKQKEWNTRLNILKCTIDYWLQHKTNKMIEIVQLYYDNFVPF